MKHSAVLLLTAAMAVAGGNVAGQSKKKAAKIPISEAKIEGIELQESSLPAALDFLQVKAGAAGAFPRNFVLYDPKGTIALREPSVSLKLNNIPLSYVLKYICDISGTSWVIDRDAILIGDKTELGELKEIRRSGPANISKNPQILKLAKIPIVDLDFSEIELATAIDYFRSKANENPKIPGPPVNFWLKESMEADLGNRLVTLKLKDVSLLQAFRYTTELAGCTMRLDQTAIVVGEKESLADRPRFLAKPGNALERKLTTSLINDIELIDTPFNDVLTFIRQKTKDAARFSDGVNIINQAGDIDKTVTLKFAKARAIDVLKYANEATDTTFRSEVNAVIVKKRPPKPQPKPKVTADPFAK